jgi:hypothetical protein
VQYLQTPGNDCQKTGEYDAHREGQSVHIAHSLFYIPANQPADHLFLDYRAQAPETIHQACDRNGVFLSRNLDGCSSA